jgi:hypothetical protein
MRQPDLHSVLKEDEINLKDVAKVLKAAVLPRLKIISFTFVFFILVSFLDYFLSPLEYKSEATLLLESGSGNENANSLAIAGLIGGISEDNGLGGGAVSPDMYGKIVSSQAFLNALVVSKIPANQDGKDSTTIEQYFAKGAPLSFYQKVKNFPLNIKSIFTNPAIQESPTFVPLPKSVDTTLVVQRQIGEDMFFSDKVPPIVQLDGLRSGVISIMKSRIKVIVTGKLVTVNVKMPDSFMAAIVNKILLQQLIDYVTAYKTVKERANIAYLERSYLEAKSNYVSKQQRLAGERDNSLGVIFLSAQTRQEVMANELAIAFNIYNQNAVQLEAAKIELKKETPLFTVIEPIGLPSPQVEPVLYLIILKYFIVAIVLSFLIIGHGLFTVNKNQ